MRYESSSIISVSDPDQFCEILDLALARGGEILSSGRERGVWWALLARPKAPPAEPVLEPARGPSSAAPAPPPTPAPPAPAEALLSARGGAREQLRERIMRAFSKAEGRGVGLLIAEKRILCEILERELS